MTELLTELFGVLAACWFGAIIGLAAVLTYPAERE